jgi:hypothetical protein
MTKSVVDDYVARFRSPAARELEFFRRLGSDEDAVQRAAEARLPSGKRHPHQRRIPRAALQESSRRLLGNLPRLRLASSFDELFDLVEAVIRPIPKIGELAVYDTALRIGARFGLEPDKVYVHAGTRDGLKALGFSGRERIVVLNELPQPIRRLSAREAEDLLCIYKSQLRNADASARGCLEAARGC